MVDVLFSTEQQEGTQSMVSQWFKKVGDTVKENEPLVEVSTDKVNVEIASPASGVLQEILKNDGEQITPGDRLAVIAQGDSSSAGTKPESASRPKPAHVSSAASASGASSGSQDLSPAVRKLLKEHSLTPDLITGTGKGGRITHEDVMNFLAKGGASGAAAACGDHAAKSRMVPHTAMRRQIAQHMTHSLMQVAPHVTSVFEADLSNVIAHREKHKAAFEKQGIRLTFTSYFVAAAVKGIQASPEVNSRYHEQALEIFDDINIGIATAVEPTSANSDAGLIVPVLMAAQKLSLLETAQRLQGLTEKARAGTLTQAEVRGGTFTISNHGVSGSLIATPIIINQPQSAILGIGKLERRPSVVSDSGKESVVIRPKVYVTLTLDHRVLDGFKANAFLRAFVETLEGSWS